MQCVMLHRDKATNLFGTPSRRLALGLLGLCLLLGPGWARAQAPNLAYSAPIIIRHGGTYTGNYRSTDSAVPVVLIETTEPVVLANCTLVGPGDLIYSPFPADLAVRECRGYGTAPTLDNTPRGVFATRTPNRPNPIGLSVVAFDRILPDGRLEVRYLDCVNGTPLLDLKPYLPSTDSEPDASMGWLTPHRTSRPT